MVRVSDVKVHAKVIVHAKIKGYIHGHGDVEFLFFNIFYNYILKTCFFFKFNDDIFKFRNMGKFKLLKRNSLSHIN